MEVRGKIGKPNEPDEMGVFGIYRTRKINGKNVVEKMPFYKPTNPRTAAQTWNRTKFLVALLFWRSLPQEDKNIWNELARGQRLYGVNLCIRDLMT